VRTGGWLLVVEIVAVIAIAVGCVQLSRSLDAVHSPWQPAPALGGATAVGQPSAAASATGAPPEAAAESGPAAGQARAGE
jgi:hypothetical protein